MSPPAGMPLVELRALQSVVNRRPAESSGSPPPASLAPFPTCKTVPLPRSSPASFSSRGFILSWTLRSPSESFRARVPASPCSRGDAFPGVPCPPGDVSHREPARDSQAPRFRPRRFSRPRRVVPSSTSRVCFTPLPPPGSYSPGVSPSSRWGRLVDVPSPRAVAAEPLPHGCPQGATSRRARLQGVLLPEVRCLGADG